MLLLALCSCCFPVPCGDLNHSALLLGRITVELELASWLQDGACSWCEAVRQGVRVCHGICAVRLKYASNSRVNDLSYESTNLAPLPFSSQHICSFSNIVTVEEEDLESKMSYFLFDIYADFLDPESFLMIFKILFGVWHIRKAFLFFLKKSLSLELYHSN